MLEEQLGKQKFEMQEEHKLETSKLKDVIKS